MCAARLLRRYVASIKFEFRGIHNNAQHRPIPTDLRHSLMRNYKHRNNYRETYDRQASSVRCAAMECPRRTRNRNRGTFSNRVCCVPRCGQAQHRWKLNESNATRHCVVQEFGLSGSCCWCFVSLEMSQTTVYDHGHANDTQIQCVRAHASATKMRTFRN